MLADVKRLLLLLGVNGAALGVLIIGMLTVTDRYVQARARTTLIYEGHPLHRQQLVPNQSVDVYGAHIDIGRHGLRGEAPMLPKPDTEARVFVMGGSSVFDINVSKSWAEALTPGMRAAGATQVRSYNAGMPGFTSRESLALYEDKVRFLDPDVVVLYQGWNDAKYMHAFLDHVDVDGFYRLAADPADSYRFLTDPRPLRNIRALMRMLSDFGGNGLQEQVRQGRLRDAELAQRDLDVDWMASPGMGYWKRNLKDFVHAVETDGAQPVLMAQATLVTEDLSQELRQRVRYKFVGVGHADIVQINELMVQTMREVAEEEGVPMIDVRSSLNGRSEYFADHVHLSPKGSAVLARVAAPVLAQTLNKGRLSMNVAKP